MTPLMFYDRYSAHAFALRAVWHETRTAAVAQQRLRISQLRNEQYLK